MKIVYGWLKDYVDLKLTPEKLAQTLTMAGLSVESVQDKAGEKIIEIEITANRPDWLSYIGVAREVAAITGKKIKVPAVAKISGKGPMARIRVEDRTLCPKYTGRVINGVKVGPSPLWLASKMEAMGLRTVNNIVDITNFCLFETGEPMHAFDLDKIYGDVVVRRARQGEKMLAIDGVERALESSMLVIADSKGPIAIAGVMGGLRTEVGPSTKNVLLEAAYFDPISVRRTSRKLALSTESSYRFERKVSIANIRYSSDRAALMIKDLARGSMGGFTDIGPAQKAAKPIKLDIDRLNRILGAGISTAAAKKILVSLGLNVSSAKRSLKAAAPDYRQDLKNAVDLVEEVARIYGYDNLPCTIPPIMEQPVRTGPEIAVRGKAGGALVALGFNEAKTYTLLSKKTLAASGSQPDRVVEIANPLSAEQEAMRTSMLPGLLGAALWNINRKAKDLKLFEIGNIYIREDSDKFSQQEHLGLCACGELSQGWMAAPRPYGFFDIKGAVESVALALGVKDITFKNIIDSRFETGACASVSIGAQQIGMAGQVSQRLAAAFDIKEKVFFAEVCLGKMADFAKLEKKLDAIPRYPSVTRDISVLVPASVRNSDLVECARKSAGTMLVNIDLIDRYTGKQIPDGKISLTYRLEYRDPGRTLEEKDVSQVHSRVLQALESDLGAKQR